MRTTVPTNMRIADRAAALAVIEPLAPAAACTPAGRQTLDSRALFAAGSEVVIAHGDERYRLRLTRQNRLILTK